MIGPNGLIGTRRIARLNGLGGMGGAIRLLRSRLWLHVWRRNAVFSPNGSCARFLYAFVDEEISHGIVGSPALNGLSFARLSFFLSPQAMRAFPSVALYGIPNACAIGTATKSIRH